MCRYCLYAFYRLQNTLSTDPDKSPRCPIGKIAFQVEFIGFNRNRTISPQSVIQNIRQFALFLQDTLNLVKQFFRCHWFFNIEILLSDEIFHAKKGSISIFNGNTFLCLKSFYCYIKFITLHKLLSILIQIRLCPL